MLPGYSYLWSSQLWATFYQLNYDIAINKLLSKKDRDNYIFFIRAPSYSVDKGQIIRIK